MDKQFMYELLETASVSGNEMELEEKLYRKMSACKGLNVTVDEIGNVVAAINVNHPLKVLLTGHADEIGLMISNYTSQGLLKVVKQGGIYPSCYLGQKVRIHTQNGIVYGAVVTSRSLCKKEGLSDKDITIDIGANTKEEAMKVVALGDTVTYDTDHRELLNGNITGRALDDRIGAFIVMEAVKKAQELGCEVGAYAAATTGEETTKNGAYFVSSRIQPTMAIAVDVTWANDCPETENETGTVELGKGPVLCNNPSIHKKINQWLIDAAKSANIPIQTEAASGHTYTDGDDIHKSGKGVPFALVSIPLRYMHTPAEVGNLKDIENCIDLLAEFLHQLTSESDLHYFK